MGAVVFGRCLSHIAPGAAEGRASSVIEIVASGRRLIRWRFLVVPAQLRRREEEKEKMLQYYKNFSTFPAPIVTGSAPSSSSPLSRKREMIFSRRLMLSGQRCQDSVLTQSGEAHYDSIAKERGKHRFGPRLPRCLIYQ